MICFNMLQKREKLYTLYINYPNNIILLRIYVQTCIRGATIVLKIDKISQ